ncbi:unnamed protein product [Protopolystoma xenopodis]|uniref:Uncharacterized protein n=1 Tax=Protopolystoma xenopodis TaxID=117903 RepID=A0A448XJ03_9PLAT|nr:unnamed protein product [Protopolystoma xenopodis]
MIYPHRDPKRPTSTFSGRDRDREKDRDRERPASQRFNFPSHSLHQQSQHHYSHQHQPPQQPLIQSHLPPSAPISPAPHRTIYSSPLPPTTSTQSFPLHSSNQLQQHSPFSHSPHQPQSAIPSLGSGVTHTRQAQSTPSSLSPALSSISHLAQSISKHPDSIVGDEASSAVSAAAATEALLLSALAAVSGDPNGMAAMLSATLRRQSSPANQTSNSGPSIPAVQTPPIPIAAPLKCLFVYFATLFLVFPRAPYAFISDFPFFFGQLASGSATSAGFSIPSSPGTSRSGSGCTSFSSTSGLSSSTASSTPTLLSSDPFLEAVLSAASASGFNEPNDEISAFHLQQQQQIVEVARTFLLSGNCFLFLYPLSFIHL